MNYQEWLKSKGLTDSPQSQSAYRIYQSVQKGQPMTQAVPMVPANTAPVMSANQQAANPTPKDSFDFNAVDSYYNNSTPVTDQAGVDKRKAALDALLSQTKGNLATWASANPDEFARLKAQYNQQAANTGANARSGSAEEGMNAAFNRKNEMLNDVFNMLSQGKTTFQQKVDEHPKSIINKILNMDIPVAGETPAPTPTTAPAPEVLETASPGAPPTVTVAEPPVPEGPAAPQGVDWNKVGEIAKSTGKSILGVLQAITEGRTAGLQNRKFDINDTIIGQDAQKAEAEKARQATEAQDQKKFEWQAQLQTLSQNFQAEQNRLQIEAEQAINSAKTEEERQARKEEYAQRWKELQFQGEQKMRELAAGKMTAKTMGGDPLGIMGPK